jgi:hypothetical protein
VRLDEYIEGLEPDAAAERRKLAEEKSYEILDYLDDVSATLDADGGSFGSEAPSVFVGRSSYPEVSAGILSPMDAADDPASFATSSAWYGEGLGIEGVLQRRTGLLNSDHSANASVHDTWDGFLGTQREVAIADGPVGVEIGLSGKPDLDWDVDDVTTPTGPRASADSASLTENPYVPKQVKKTLEDDDWGAQGAMTYLYRRGLDVYDINDILSVGALGEAANRKLVPTRWSITAVDDTVGQYLRGRIRNNPAVDKPRVWMNEYMGNRYWVVLAPGRWEFELVEMKSPGSVWNPDPAGDVWMASAHEGYEGRSGYVEETAGAYYAARIGVLEHLDDIGRQAKALVLREVSDDYWAPVGVWQIRESVRNAFDGEGGRAQTFHGAVSEIAPNLPVSTGALRRKSTLVAGTQSDLSAFTG